MYSLIQRPDKSCDVFLNNRVIGVWRGLVFHPSENYVNGVPITLMRFLLSDDGRSKVQTAPVCK